MERLSRHSTLILILGLTLVLAGASGGSCPGGLSKVDNVTDALSGGADFSILSQCESFATFKATVDPVFERQCLSCHGSGGKGAGKYLLAVANTDNTSGIANNFAATMTKFLPDDAGNLESNIILAKINGTLTHDITLGATSEDYAAIYTWVAEERANPCAAAGDMMPAPVAAPTGGTTL